MKCDLIKTNSKSKLNLSLNLTQALYIVSNKSEQKGFKLGLKLKLKSSDAWLVYSKSIYGKLSSSLVGFYINVRVRLSRFYKVCRQLLVLRNFPLFFPWRKLRMETLEILDFVKLGRFMGLKLKLVSFEPISHAFMLRNSKWYVTKKVSGVRVSHLLRLLKSSIIAFFPAFHTR